jgi:hypothetical protein
MNELKINTVEYSTQLLKDSFPKGSTVYLVIRQVSRSGMYRHISVHGIKDNKVSYYSYHVAKVLKWAYKDKTNAVGVVGWIWAFIWSTRWRVCFMAMDML